MQQSLARVLQPATEQIVPDQRNISLTLSAPAKLNLSLIVKPEVVQGKHLLDSVFTTLDLADRLDFNYQPDSQPALRIKMDYAANLPALRLAQPKNIVYQALRTFEDKFACSLNGNLTIHVTKNIPSQAGLGGGSSDAAAVLIAMQQLLGITVDAQELRLLAAKLGADVAFFLEGGCAQMGGFGDKFIKRLTLPELNIVLVKPRQGLSTARVYKEFSLESEFRTNCDIIDQETELGFNNPLIDYSIESPPTSSIAESPLTGYSAESPHASYSAITPLSSIDPLLELLGSSVLQNVSSEQPTTADKQATFTKDLAAVLTNNLTPAAVRLLPEIASLLSTLTEQAGIHKALLAGSGSTVFGLAESREDAQKAASLFSARGYWTAVCRTV